jgi:stearoyl-CoA desaturase (delta-9 desaturase)
VIPPLALAAGMYLYGGLPWLIWGFCLPTATLAHATFAINTINHMFGSRRFQTADDSTNNPFTAFFAAGEGWHNNHHRYQRAARNGFYWWEFDPTYYVIWLMEKAGLAWDVQRVPQRIYREATSGASSQAAAVDVEPVST